MESDDFTIIQTHGVVKTITISRRQRKHSIVWPNAHKILILFFGNIFLKSGFLVTIEGDYGRNFSEFENPVDQVLITVEMSFHRYRIYDNATFSGFQTLNKRFQICERQFILIRYTLLENNVHVAKITAPNIQAPTSTRINRSAL